MENWASQPGNTITHFPLCYPTLSRALLKESTVTYVTESEEQLNVAIWWGRKNAQRTYIKDYMCVHLNQNPSAKVFVIKVTILTNK